MLGAQGWATLCPNVSKLAAHGPTAGVHTPEVCIHPLGRGKQQTESLPVVLVQQAHCVTRLPDLDGLQYTSIMQLVHHLPCTRNGCSKLKPPKGENCLSTDPVTLKKD